jgi:glyoxylate reductase
MNEPNVYITGYLPDEAISIVAAHADVRVYDTGSQPMPREELFQAVRDVEGLLVFFPDQIDKAVIDAAPKLKVVSTCAVGFDNIDIAACTARGIAVGHTPGVLTETTADLAWALLMAAARRVAEGDRVVRAGKWPAWHLMYMVGQDVWGATIGIVGMGRIGQAMARRAKGFNMRILYSDSQRREEIERETGARKADVDEIIAESDFITLHVPATPETNGMIGAAQFKAMKKTAIFVNSARGSVVDQAALTEALRSGQIAAAGLDVYEKEPIPADDPLLQLENVALMPHVGSASVRTRTSMAKLAAENLVAGLLGKPLPRQVNPEVGPKN